MNLEEKTKQAIEKIEGFEKWLEGSRNSRIFSYLLGDIKREVIALDYDEKTQSAVIVLQEKTESYPMNQTYGGGEEAALFNNIGMRQVKVYRPRNENHEDVFDYWDEKEMGEILDRYHLGVDMDYETPRGQRPTLNSFLLWVAKRENIPAASLWVPIPFYLVATEDPRAWKTVLEFFGKRFDLKIDFTDLDQAIRDQDKKLAQARLRFPDIDDYIRRLESNIGLSEEENEKLVKEIEEFLGESSS